MKKYLFSREHNTWLPEVETIQYSKCHDGVVITGGSLIATGFAPPDAGITLPEEIEGIAVVELRGVFSIKAVRYIEARYLKRINILLSNQDN